MAEADGPKIDTISKTDVNAELLSLTGSNFISISTCSISFRSVTNDSIVFEIPSDTCDNTSATFTVPRTLPTGPYLVRVRNEIG